MPTPPPPPYDFPDNPDKAVALILKGFQHEMEAILQSNDDFKKVKKGKLKKLCDALKKGIDKAEGAKTVKGKVLGSPAQCAQGYTDCCNAPPSNPPRDCPAEYFYCMSK
mgnify:CR=1 FL=1